MAALSTIIAAGALITAVAGTAISVVNANRARAAQDKATALQNVAQKRSQVREARLRRGRVLNASALAGTVGSSGESGALGSIQSQLGTNLYFLDVQLGLAQTVSRSQAAAQTAGAIASLAGKTFTAVGGASKIATAFRRAFPGQPAATPLPFASGGN